MTKGECLEKAETHLENSMAWVSSSRDPSAVTYAQAQLYAQWATTYALLAIALDQ